MDDLIPDMLHWAYAQLAKKRILKASELQRQLRERFANRLSKYELDQTEWTLGEIRQNDSKVFAVGDCLYWLPAAGKIEGVGLLIRREDCLDLVAEILDKKGDELV